MHPLKAEQTHPSYQNTLIAATTSGFIGAYAGFFFQATKKRLQSGQQLPRISEIGPRKWVRETFRGSFSFSVCLVPTSVIQQMTDEYCKRQHITDARWMTTFFSGALGGIASTFVENVLLQQQMRNASARDAIQALLRESPTRIFRGGYLIMAREAVFGFCYLSAAKQASDYATCQFGSTYAFLAQMIVGVVGSLISHPLDTMATTMQQYRLTKASDAARHLFLEKKGIQAFYKGALARIGLFTTTMIVIGETQRSILNRLER